MDCDVDAVDCTVVALGAGAVSWEEREDRCVREI
jgi:hypothetical protein